MIDFDVLNSLGTTNERLKEIFIATPDPDLKPKKGETKEERRDRLARARKNNHDVETRERFRRLLQTRVEEGIVNSLRNWKLYAAVDLAWDTSAVSGMTLPLMMYAQKKINVERATHLLSSLKNGDEFIKKNEAGVGVDINVPRFVETNINLIRSVISRRHAAQVNKFNQLYPYYKFEARSTGIVAKCRADVLSQRMDIMTDQFGYRHHDAQVMRDSMLYGHSVDFMRSSWEIEKQYERKDLSGPPEGDNLQAVITKEGVGWFNPHPSRVFWDNASGSGLASINNDDIGWFGFWDVCRFSEIDDNPLYFNKTAVGWTGRFWGDAGVYNTYKDYFTHYTYTLIPPASGEIDPAKANDRTSIVGFYSGNQRDASVFTSNMFMKIVPKDWGIGEYPWPIWIRLVTASDSTTIFAEIMPTCPAAYLGINENDARQVNVSMAMELFSFQDQMTNLCTHLMLVCQMELFKVIGINKDMIEGKDLAAIRQRLKGRLWMEDPLILEYSVSKLIESGIDPKKVIEIAELHQGQTIDAIFGAMVKLVEMAEKLIAMSPAEQGQPAPREISATEVNEIATTTSSIYSFISESIDEYRAAKKKACYEALVACGKGDVVCPVKDRYTPDTIKKAGFQTKQGEDEDFNTSAPNLKGRPKRQTVIGSKRSLVHDYIFTTRDGSERPVNTQAANTLVQLVGQALSVPTIAQAMGKEKLYEIFNEVFRMSGAGVDLLLTVHEGEDDSLGGDDIAQMKQLVQQLQQYIQKMAGQLQKNAQDITALDQQEADLKQTVGHLSRLADQVKQLSDQVNQVQASPHAPTMQAVKRSMIESIKYSDAPASIQRQMEQQAGFTPASDAERNGDGDGKSE